MKVRHSITGLTGEVTGKTLLTAKDVGDMAGKWYAVTWADGFRSLVQAASVEEVPQ